MSSFAALSSLSVAHRLLCHPSRPCSSVHDVEVCLARDAKGDLAIAYCVQADTGVLVLPPAEDASFVPTDGLWQHTCCEAFLSRAGNAAYREFNFSPSGAWASYGFSNTRLRDPAGERDWQKPPAIRVDHSAQGFTLFATLSASQLSVGAGALWVGLSAVIETRDNDGKTAACSYWALHHPLAHPDFHHRDTFTLRLD